MKSIFASCVFALMALTASRVSASPLTLADVGSVDPLIANTNLANSNDATDKAWISTILDIPLANLTYQKVTASSGANWQQISDATDLFAFNLGSDPSWFLVKTGAGSPFNRYLFSNGGKLDWAVVNFDDFGFDEVNIEKIGYVGIASDPESGSNELIAPVPEPASLTLLGLGLTATAGAIRRRRRKA